MTQQIIDMVTDSLMAKIEHHLSQFDVTTDFLDATVNSMHSAIDNMATMKEEQTLLLTQQHNAFQQSLATLETTTAKVSLTMPNLPAAATPYRDALINVSASRPANHPMIDPQTTQQILTQSKRVLIDIDITITKNTSISSICDLANETAANLKPPTELSIAIEEVTRLRNGAILLHLNSKEAADWVRSQEIRSIFAEGFSFSATIKDRGYPIMIPAVPFSFHPSEPHDLRELEERNRLPPSSIISARWLKPPSHHTEDQTHGHCTITLNSAESANITIRDNITIAGKRVHPSKLKKEPLWCLRCQRWGHRAIDCSSHLDVCGTCGQDHHTSDCVTYDIHWCVSCKDTSHCSWDRRCPSFLR